MREVVADVMVVAAYGLILPQVVLDLPRYGCLNIHASLLPRWRGAAPIQRRHSRRRCRGGVCIMRDGAGLRYRSSAAVREVPIERPDDGGEPRTMTGRSFGGRLYRRCAGLPATIAHLQPEAGHGAAKIEKAEAPIDWRQSANDDRQVRAFNLSPGRDDATTGPRSNLAGVTRVGDRPRRTAGN